MEYENTEEAARVRLPVHDGAMRASAARIWFK